MKEEQAIDVVLDGVADRGRKCEQEHLCDCEERCTEHDIANRPTIIKRAENEHQLRNGVDDSTHKRPEDVNDPKSYRLRVAKARESLECRDGKEEAESKKDKACNAD
jgi:hypothetical protein